MADDFAGILDEEGRLVGVAGRHFEGEEGAVRIDGETGDGGQTCPDGFGVAAVGDFDDFGGAIGIGCAAEVADEIAPSGATATTVGT